MDGRCIYQNELAQRWQVSEATLERWRSQRKGPQFLRLGGQVRYRLVDVESCECARMEVFGTGQNNLKTRISPVQTDNVRGLRKLARLAGDQFKLGVLLYDGDETLPLGDNIWAAPLATLWGK